MVLAAAAADSIFIQYAQARSSFAGIQNPCFCSMDGVNIFACGGGDPAQPLQNVQDYPLTGKQRPRIVPHHGNGLPFMQPHAIKNFPMTDDFRVADHVAVKVLIDLQNAGDCAYASENAVLLGQDSGGGALLCVNTGARGGIARCPVFKQSVFQNCAESAAVPVHSFCRFAPNRFKNYRCGSV